MNELPDAINPQPHRNSYPYEQDGIDENEKAQLENTADNITSRTSELKRRVITEVIAIGEQLETAHNILSAHGNGTWGRWVEERCGLSRSTAHRYITIWQTWGDCVTLTQSADLTALWMIARHEKAVAWAKKRMEGGERLTAKVAKKLLTTAKIQDQKIPGKARKTQPPDDAKKDDDPRCRLCKTILSRGVMGDLCGQCRRYENSPNFPPSDGEDAILAMAPSDPDAKLDDDEAEIMIDTVQSRWDNTRQTGQQDEDTYGSYTWLDLMEDAPTDPTEHWRTATVFDYDQMEDDVVSVVAYHWKLALGTRPSGDRKKPTQRLLHIQELLMTMARSMSDEMRKREKRNSKP